MQSFDFIMKNRNFVKVPLHERIADDLRQELLALDEGVKISTEPELAERYGVSVPTLRIAMTILVHEGIVIRKHGSGSYIAPKKIQNEPVVSSNRRIVGVPVFLDHFAEPCATDYWLRFYHFLFRGMEEHGIAFRMLPASPMEDQHSAEFSQFIQSPEAVALLLSNHLPQSLLDNAESKNVPCFGIFGTAKNLTVSTGLNYTTMSATALDYFQTKGRQRVGMIAWAPDKMQTLSVGSNNESPNVGTFKQFAQRRGLASKNSWICSDLHPKNKGAGWSALREIWSASSLKPDAIFVSDSGLLPGVLEATRELRIRIPEDLLVLSQSNSPQSYDIPENITKIEYHLSDFCDPLIEGIRRTLNGENLEPGAVVEVSGSLIEADSDRDTEPHPSQAEISIGGR